MRNFVCIADHKPGTGLNVRELLNPLFYSVDTRHPDMKRQRSRRQRSRALDAARRLKTQCSTWVPELPETHAWENWFFQLGWACKEFPTGRRYNEY